MEALYQLSYSPNGTSERYRCRCSIHNDPVTTTRSQRPGHNGVSVASGFHSSFGTSLYSRSIS